MAESPLDNAQVADALKRVPFPGYSRDIVSFGFVKGVEIHLDRPVRVVVRLQLPATDPAQVQALQDAIGRAISDLPGSPVAEVQVQTAAPAPAAGGRPAPPAAQGIPGVRHLIAVASGKGGVGKSTVAVNLAVALARAGASTGLLDSDIYGPSIPMMMGISGQPETRGNRILPLQNHGVRTMSIGYLLESDDAPVIWRGPMVMKALTQFLRDVEWGDLEFLVIDLPPGTGDAQLTLVQSVPLSGAVVVTTPQDVALIDAKKAVSMFRRTEVPILGIIENMSGFACPSCGHHEPIFGEGGGRREAERQGVPFLGAVPLEAGVRAGGDRGEPIVVASPQSPVALAFVALADAVRRQLAVPAP